MPSEILQEMYKLLSPIEFDAARHTNNSFDRFELREEPPGDEEETMNSVAITIEGGPGLSITNLCSFDNPPGSIAICSQRRCVIFGCRTGIELH